MNNNLDDVPVCPEKPPLYFYKKEEVHRFLIYGYGSISCKDIPECDNLYIEISNEFDVRKAKVICYKEVKYKNKDYKKLLKLYKEEYKDYEKKLQEYNKKLEEKKLQEKIELFNKLKKELKR